MGKCDAEIEECRRAWIALREYEDFQLLSQLFPQPMKPRILPRRPPERPMPVRKPFR